MYRCRYKNCNNFTFLTKYCIITFLSCTMHSVYFISIDLNSQAITGQDVKFAANHNQLYEMEYANTLFLGESGRVDYANFRYLLWKCMELFLDYAESRSRIVVPVFLDFCEKEVTLWEDSLMKAQDISASTNKDSNKVKEKFGKDAVLFTDANLNDNGLGMDEHEMDTQDDQNLSTDNTEIVNAITSDQSQSSKLSDTMTKGRYIIK